MLTDAMLEPISHFFNSPDVVTGNAADSSTDNVEVAMKWSFLHKKFSAWRYYAIFGFAHAFFSYSHGLPLAIRSSLTALFGRALEGLFG